MVFARLKLRGWMCFGYATLACVLGVMLFVSGCARDIDAGHYDESHVGEASKTFAGTIQSVRTVLVTGSERLQDNTMGMGLGGLAGGALGALTGKGHGRTAMMGVGALAGATAGAFAEKEMKKQKGIEYIVALDHPPSPGQAVMTVVQGPSQPLAVGDRVFVIVGQKGRSRVIPRV